MTRRYGSEVSSPQRRLYENVEMRWRQETDN